MHFQRKKLISSVGLSPFPALDCPRFERWTVPVSCHYLVKSIELFGNRFEDVGYGWGHAQRPNKNATHLLAYGFRSEVESIFYHDNYFGLTRQCMFWWFSRPTIRHVRLDSNTYVQPGVDPESHRGLFRWRDEHADCQPTWADYCRLTGCDSYSMLLNDMTRIRC